MATQTRLPTGDGSTSAWTALGGGSKFSEVDDPIGTPDEDTTYVSRVNTAGTQLYTFSAFAVPSGSTINFVRVFARMRMAAGSATAALILRVNGTNSVINVGAQTASYADETNDWLTNPNTGLAWTVDDVNGVGADPLQEFGHRTDSGFGAGEEMRCTQCYAEVDYTESAATRGIAFGTRGSAFNGGKTFVGALHA
jgi:hypothetical protein